MDPGGDSTYISTLAYCILDVYSVLYNTVIVSLEKVEPNPFSQRNIIRLKNYHFLKDGRRRHSTQHSYFNGRGQPAMLRLWWSLSSLESFVDLKKTCNKPSSQLSKLHYYNASAPSPIVQQQCPPCLPSYGKIL